MELEPRQDLLGIAITQSLILIVAWAFYIVVRINNALALPDAVAIWVYRNPTETTLVVTIVATVASSMTLRCATRTCIYEFATCDSPFVRYAGCSCFTRAAKHALRQHIGARKSISLADLSIGVAAARASFMFKRRPRYFGPTLVTLFIAVVFGLVNSAYVFSSSGRIQ